VYRFAKHLFLGIAALTVVATAAAAQSRVGSDSSTRLTRFGRDFIWGTVEGLAFAAYDQWKLDPPQWGTGWHGYGKRAASNLGEFYIQEGTTEGIAALMDRPLDYRRCRCKEFGDRFVHAMRGAVTDELRNGSHPIAIPRIAGAYVGSFSQAGWRPNTGNDRVRVALVNGTTSLAIGALINLYHEIRR
jgi:hypothetical protein